MRSSGSRLNTIHNLHFYLDLMRSHAGGHRRPAALRPWRGPLLRPRRGRRTLWHNAAPFRWPRKAYIMSMALISDAWAQAAPGGPERQFTPLLMMVVFIVIFYFLLIRPQQKRAKEHQSRMLPSWRPAMRS